MSDDGGLLKAIGLFLLDLSPAVFNFVVGMLAVFRWFWFQREEPREKDKAAQLDHGIITSCFLLLLRAIIGHILRSDQVQKEMKLSKDESFIDLVSLLAALAFSFLIWIVLNGTSWIAKKLMWVMVTFIAFVVMTKSFSPNFIMYIVVASVVLVIYCVKRKQISNGFYVFNMSFIASFAIVYCGSFIVRVLQYKGTSESVHGSGFDEVVSDALSFTYCARELVCVARVVSVVSLTCVRVFLCFCALRSNDERARFARFHEEEREIERLEQLEEEEKGDEAGTDELKEEQVA